MYVVRNTEHLSLSYTLCVRYTLHTTRYIYIPLVYIHQLPRTKKRQKKVRQLYRFVFFKSCLYMQSPARPKCYYTTQCPSTHVCCSVLEIVSLRVVVTQPAPPATRSAAEAVRQPNPLHSAHAEQQQHDEPPRAPRAARKAELAPPIRRRGACCRAPRTTAPRRGAHFYIYTYSLAID